MKLAIELTYQYIDAQGPDDFVHESTVFLYADCPMTDNEIRRHLDRECPTRLIRTMEVKEVKDE